MGREKKSMDISLFGFRVSHFFGCFLCKKPLDFCKCQSVVFLRPDMGWAYEILLKQWEKNLIGYTFQIISEHCMLSLNSAHMNN